jgi:hypothetical protein
MESKRPFSSTRGMSDSGSAGLQVQHPPKMKPDTHLSLAEIREQHQKSLVEQMLGIQKFTDVGQKSTEFVKELQCLTWSEASYKRRRLADDQRTSEPSKYLQRDWVAADQPNSPFVAISYPWQDPPGEDSTRRGYKIVSEDGERVTPSDVRDIVFNRLIAYAKHYGLRNIWIDQECINQVDEGKRQTAVQSMDLVYRNSRKPVALLSIQIDSQDKLDHLTGVLRKEYINGGDYGDGPLKLKPNLRPKIAIRILNLLDYITSDVWWTRAWTFQEEYCSFWKMCFLIRHRPGLDKERANEVCGNICNELEIKSADFRGHATRFCLAYLQEDGTEWQDGRAICNKVLATVKKYNVISNSGEFGVGKNLQAMSPNIFADIGHRDITKPYDILAIAANCCDYSIRLNTTGLEEAQYSLSSCLLALYLLNGEIMTNDEEETLATINIFEYLKKHSLDNFDPPVGTGELTFTKRCRFPDVELSEDGRKTTGCLWVVNEVIDTDDITNTGKGRSSDGSPVRLSSYERSLLFNLTRKLEEVGYCELSKEIEDYLDEDGNPNIERTSLSYKYLMATELIRAIEKGEKLQLGYLINNDNSSSSGDNSSSDGSSSSDDSSGSDSSSNSDGSPHRAIFICEDNTSREDNLIYEDNLISGVNSSSDDYFSRNGDDSSDDDPYRELLTSQISEEPSELVLSNASYVFTAWRPGRHIETRSGARNMDKYVSIEVDLDGLTESGLLRLRTKRWINGLCFFNGCPRLDVVFPWPAWLTK